MTPVPDPVPEPADCRVLTYNVLYDGAAVGGPGWERRRDAVVEELERLSPDVVAFQEVWLDQLSDLQAALPDVSWLAVDDTQQHTPIAYRDDRFEVLDWGSFWLVPPGTDPGRPGWDASYQRLVTRGTLQDRTGGPPLSVMSVHLDHKGEHARREGVALVRDRLSGKAPGEAVVAGDFNCRPGSPAHERATVDRTGWLPLRDATASADARKGPAETYVGFTPEDEPRNIDHLLVTPGVAVERVVTCVPRESGPPPSDHRPVFADIRY